MIRNRLVFLCTLTVLTMFIFVLSSAAAPRGYAQANPTQVRDTLNAIIDPRLTLTARGIDAQTSTAAAGLAGANANLLTNDANAILLTSQYIGTVTIEALTATYTPSSSPTPSVTPINFGNLNPTFQQATALHQVYAFLTGTFQSGSVLNQTAVIEGTVNSIFLQTLGITATPIPAVGVNLGTPLMTPNAQQIQASQQALLAQILTLTPQAIVGLTRTAAYQATIDDITNGVLTATGVSVRATLTNGFDPIGPDNATTLQKSTVILGHTASIQGVAFSPDGTEFATASLDNTVRIWNTQTADLKLAIKGLTDRTRITFSPNGAVIAAASSDTTIRLYDAQTGAEINVLHGHTKAVTSLAFSPDSATLASGSADGTIRIWDVKTGSSVLSLPLPKPSGYVVIHPPVMTIAFSPDGLRLASAGQDANITV